MIYAQLQNNFLVNFRDDSKVLIQIFIYIMKLNSKII